MTKMDMVWVAAACCIYPDVRSATTISTGDIKNKAQNLFGETISHVMVNRHLVAAKDRDANPSSPLAGGSRNRYLTEDREGQLRLYKRLDHAYDGEDKNGPSCPSPEEIPEDYRYLVDWYQRHYFDSAQ